MAAEFVFDQALYEEICVSLRNLPEREITREYEKEVVNFVMAKRKTDIMPYLRILLDSAEVEDNLAFAAFCALCERLRRNMDHIEHKKVLDQYADRFTAHPFAGHVKLLYYVDHFDYDRKDEIIELARQNKKNMPGNCGALHAFADIVAHAFEHNWIHHLNNPPSSSVLEEALASVDLAISMDEGYAKFYCTKGRLLSFRKKDDRQGQDSRDVEYALALQMVQRAIDLEDSGKTDYPIRISNYIYYQQQIQAREQDFVTEQRINHYLEQQMEEHAQKVAGRQDELERAAKDIADEMRGSMVKNLEFVGLFAGIISFTIGSISISSNLAAISFVGAAGLIIVLMGALLCVFAGFGVILHGFKKGNRLRNVLVFITGLLLTVVGLYICCAIAGIL